MNKKQDHKNDKSIKRSKKTTISFLEALGADALNAVVPGSNLIYSLSRIMVEHAKDFHEDRKKERIDDFHKALLEGVTEEDYESFLKEEYSIEDYYTLLVNAIQDDEDAKTRFYSNIFKALIKKQIPDKYKIHFIKAVRELSFNDIEKMRYIYISSNYEIKREGSKWGNSVKVDPFDNISFQALERLGFIRLKDQTVDSDYIKDATPLTYQTDLTPLLVEILYNSDELTPESIGEKSWKKMPPVFILANDLDRHKETFSELAKSLTELNIKSSVAVPDIRIQRIQLPFYDSDLLIICLEYSMAMEFHVENFVTQPRVKDKKIIKVFLSESNGEPYDPISEVKSIASFKFFPNKKHEVDEFEKFIRNETKHIE